MKKYKKYIYNYGWSRVILTGDHNLYIIKENYIIIN